MSVDPWTTLRPTDGDTNVQYLVFTPSGAGWDPTGGENDAYGCGGIRIGTTDGINMAFQCADPVNGGFSFNSAINPIGIIVGSGLYSGPYAFAVDGTPGNINMALWDGAGHETFIVTGATGAVTATSLQLSSTLTLTGGGVGILGATGVSATAGTALGLAGGAGGTATSTGTAGGALTLSGGAAAVAATATSAGAAGGAITLTGGAGSAGLTTGASGAGGALTFTAGTGAAASGASGAAGAGGAINLYTGVAGGTNGGTAGAAGTFTLKMGGVSGITALSISAIGAVTLPITLAVTGAVRMGSTLTFSAGSNEILGATGGAAAAGVAIGVLGGTGGAATTVGLAGGALTLTGGTGSASNGAYVSGAGGAINIYSGASGGTGGGGTDGGPGTITMKVGGSGGTTALTIDATGHVATPVNPIMSFSTVVHCAISDVNTGGKVVLPAIAGKGYRIWDFKLIAYGGAVTSSTATGVALSGTQSSSVVALATVAKAGLTQNAVVSSNSANVTMLANDAAFGACDANTAIIVGAVGGTDLATATYLDVIVAYTLV